MMLTRPSAIAVFLLLCITAGAPRANAQPEGVAEGFVGEAAVRADFEHLYKTLQASHFDLYVRRSRKDYDEYFHKSLTSIAGPMSRLDVVRLFMPFVAFGNIGHARIDFPIADYVRYVTGGGTLLPLDIRVENGRVFVARSYTDALEPGSELVALNGESASDWVDHLSRYVSAERQYMANAQLEAFFPRLLWLDQGQVDSFHVVVRQGSSGESAIMLAAKDGLEVEREKSVWERAALERTAEVLPGGVAYLRPGPFYAVNESEGLAEFEAFVNEAFCQFIEVGAQDLVLDLRNNPGGDNSFSDPMIAWFADQPFRFASRYEIKSSAQTRRVLRELAAGEPDGVSAQMLRAMRHREDGERFEFEIPLAHPRANSAFSGRVWALVNRHTYSNAATVAAIIQDYGFGTVIGEETSDLPTSHASSAQFVLPETRIMVTYPKGYFVRPSGDEGFRGVVPDHPLHFPIVPEEDEVLRGVTALVLSQRQANTLEP